MNVNLNDSCKVILTESGAKVLNQAIYQVGARKYNEGDIYRAQLWSLFYDFGKECFLGNSELPFKDLTIEVTAQN